MNLRRSIKPGRKQLSLAFTLAEAMISIAVAAISIGGILYGFILFGQRAEWSTCSTAAQSMAMRRLEQTRARSEEHTSELQSQFHLVCRLLLEKKNNTAPRRDRNG